MREPDHDDVAATSRRWLLSRRTVLLGLGVGAGALTSGATWFATTRYAAGPPHRGVLAVTGATVLVGPQLAPISPATVVVRDDRIVAVGPDAEVAVPAGARRLDGTGSTVLPGLIDAHVHLAAPELDRGEDLHLGRIPGLVLDLIRHAPVARRAFLDHGVTTVRSLGDDLGWVVELRRALADGDLEGPRVLTAGPLFTTRGGHPVVTFDVDPDGDGVRLPTTPAEARTAVRRLAEADEPVDLIKVVQERGRAGFAMAPLPPDVLRAIVEQAHAYDLPVTTHWGTLEDLHDALDAGTDGLEHVEARGVLDGWGDGRLDRLVDEQVVLSPTLAVTEGAVPADAHARLRQRVREAHDAGVALVAGSDAGVPGVRYGAGLHRELELLVASGLTPREALRAATSVAAGALRRADLGVVAPDRAADLVVVAGRPDRDLADLRRIRLVLRDGRVVVDRRAT